MLLSAANVPDAAQLGKLLDAVPPLPTPSGRRRWRPEKVHADKAYDSRSCRASCRLRGIVPRIARRGVESSERLGRYRWVVERTFAWLHRFRRLVIRYERRADIHLAFLLLACAIICFKLRSLSFVTSPTAQDGTNSNTNESSRTEPRSSFGGSTGRRCCGKRRA